MATDDASLMVEVREQTELTDPAILSDDRLSALISNAKREISSSLTETPDFYANVDAENALFWLSCLFVIGENTDSFAMGELRVDPNTDDNSEHPWMVRYRRSLSHLMNSESLFGIRSVNRNDRAGRPEVRDGEAID